MTLPVNIDATYADSGTDASVQAHQQHHDIVHSAVNGLVYAPAVAAMNGLTLDPTGATDQTAIMDACYTVAKAAITAGAGGARIQWPTGTFLLSPGSLRYGVKFDRNLAGTIELCGDRTGTTFRLSANCPSLVGPVIAGLTITDVFQHLHLHDFTVDNNNVTSTASGQQGVVTHFATTTLNVDDFLIERVDTINVGAPIWTGLERRNVNITSDHATVGTADPQTTVTNITVRDCNFGRSGGGGNQGVHIGAFISATARFNYSIVNGDVVANTWLDNITVDRVTWRSGITTYATHNAAYNGAGIQVCDVGTAGKVRIRDNYLVGSTDDLIETGTIYDCVISGNYVEDCMSEAIYVRACNGGLPNPERQRVVVENNTVRYNLVVGSALTTFPFGVWFHAKDYGIPAGDMVARNNHIYSTVGLPCTAPGLGVKVTGAFNSVVIDGVTGGVTGWTNTGATFTSARFVEVVCPVGRGGIEIRNITPVFTVTHNGSNTLQLFGVSIGACSDYRVRVDGVHPMWRNVVKGSTGTLQTADVEIFDGNGLSTADAFTTLTTFANSYHADAGSITDLAVSGGVLTSTANHTTEKRLTWFRNDTDYTFGQVGPSTDGYVTAKFAPPTTPAAGYKAGVRLRVSKDGLNSIHCYVTYDGAAYSMKVDTEQAGVLTNQATVSIGASLPASPFWVRGGIIGSAVTADILTTAPSARGTSPAASTSAAYTLTGTPLATFGPDAAQGYPGIVWVPQDTGSTLDDLTRWHQGSMSLSVSRVGAREVLMTGVTSANARGVLLASSFATTSRVTKNYELDDCDFTMYAQNGVTEFSGFATADKALVTQRRIGWVTRPAAAAITVTASPFTYTNQDGYPEDVAVYGGTVSNITVQRVNAASGGQVQSATGWSGRIEPGDTVTVTYTAAPTMRKVPA